MNDQHRTFQYFSFKLAIVIREYSEKNSIWKFIFKFIVFFRQKFSAKKHDVATRGAVDSPVQNSLNQKCFFLYFFFYFYFYFLCLSSSFRKCELFSPSFFLQRISFIFQSFIIFFLSFCSCVNEGEGKCHSLCPKPFLSLSSQSSRQLLT